MDGSSSAEFIQPPASPLERLYNNPTAETTYEYWDEQINMFIPLIDDPNNRLIRPQLIEQQRAVCSGQSRSRTFFEIDSRFHEMKENKLPDIQIAYALQSGYEGMKETMENMRVRTTDLNMRKGLDYYLDTSSPLREMLLNYEKKWGYYLEMVKGK